MLFGSDYPHPEGLAEPSSYVEHLPPGLTDEGVRGIMGGNLARIMRVDAPSGPQEAGRRPAVPSDQPAGRRCGSRSVPR